MASELTPEVSAALERLRKYKTTNDGASVYSDEITIGYGDSLDFAQKLSVVSALSTRDAWAVAEWMLAQCGIGVLDGR